MCGVMMALAALSTVVGAMGQVQQAQAQAAAAKYNAKVQKMNARVAERRAVDAIERGGIEEQRKRMEVARIKGQQQAAMAANGVDLSFGSPLDVMVDTAVMGELDALMIRSNAYREAYDHKVNAANHRAGAQMSRLEANSALTGGYLGAAGTVLSGVGQMYKDYKTNNYSLW